MADPNNPLGDEVSLEPNGTVRISLAGRPYRWRRPTFGEFRKFEELWAEAAVREKEILARANEVPTEDRTQGWRIGWESELQDLALPWALDVWRVLCDKEPPTVDDCPPWMANGTFHVTLKEHWTTVPLAASSR